MPLLVCIPAFLLHASLPFCHIHPCFLIVCIHAFSLCASTPSCHVHPCLLAACTHNFLSCTSIHTFLSCASMLISSKSFSPCYTLCVCSQSAFPFDILNVCSPRAPSFWHAACLLPRSMGGWKGLVGAHPVLLGPTVHVWLPLSFLHWLSHPIFSLLTLHQDPPPFPGMDVDLRRFMPIYIPWHQHNVACSCLHLVSMWTLICFIAGDVGVPFVQWFGTECDHNTMVLDLLGPSCAP